ncbi:hypothetical protein RHA1_ro02680 [Rhodococcus jostii RHA1]|uniref:Uncharacterized protein n=1 Tax=Rhodococcus jostii (strain RHA1) TaxID=101510 RepID=Q0SDA1_RHOJR|nr:hypothetical protein RHA1_ro02680 [Rhodococcus jostii RHA1]
MQNASGSVCRTGTLDLTIRCCDHRWNRPGHPDRNEPRAVRVAERDRVLWAPNTRQVRSHSVDDRMTNDPNRLAILDRRNR